MVREKPGHQVDAEQASAEYVQVEYRFAGAFLVEDEDHQRAEVVQRLALLAAGEGFSENDAPLCHEARRNAHLQHTEAA